ncbi:MAG: PAS domain S-box protein [Chloroflexi bacterium]|nr:PAS domain S-box protein [Chloroflexota bacterium]
MLAFVPDAVLVVNSQGVIVSINDETTRILGYTRDELQGQSLGFLLPERFRVSHQHHLNAYFQNPWPRPMGLSLDLAALHKQGHEIFVAVSLIPWKMEEGTVVTAFVRDITQRKLMETAVQKAQEQAQERLEQEVTRQTAELRQVNQELRQEIIERQRVEEELRLLTMQLTQRQEQLQQELSSLDQLSLTTTSTVTLQAYNLLSVAESLPTIFGELVAQYGELLDLALETKTYKTDIDLAARLRLLAERLGLLNAGPHDVVSLHSTALKAKVADVPYAKANVYFQEGRLLVLQLMGYVVAYYRSHSLFFRQGVANAATHNMPRNSNHVATED